MYFVAPVMVIHRIKKILNSLEIIGTKLVLIIVVIDSSVILLTFDTNC